MFTQVVLVILAVVFLWAVGLYNGLVKLKNRAKEAGAKDIIGVNYGTDGAMLVPDYGTPFVIMGPGKLDQLHVTDEYTEIEEVITYANIIYKAIIDNFSEI